METFFLAESLSIEGHKAMAKETWVFRKRNETGLVVFF